MKAIYCVMRLRRNLLEWDEVNRPSRLLCDFLSLPLLRCNLQPSESGWVVYGPDNGYDFPYPSPSRVKKAFLVLFSITKLIVHEAKNDSVKVKL